MDDQFRQLQRYYAQTGDSVTFQQLLQIAARSNIFSPEYLKYLSLLDIEPINQLVKTHLPTSRKIKRRLFRHPDEADRAEEKTIGAGEIRWRRFNNLWKEIAKASSGQNRYHSYQRFIGFLAKLVDLRLRSVERNYGLDIHASRRVVILEIAQELRNLIKEFQSYGPSNPPNPTIIAEHIAWISTTIDWLNEDAYDTDDIMEDAIRMLLAILDACNHVLVAFTSTAQCHTCEIEGITWNQILRNPPTVYLEYLWTSLPTRTMLRRFDWSFYGVGAPPALHDLSKLRGSRLSLVRQVDDIQLRRHWAAHVGFIALEMFRQTELELLASGVLSFSPGVCWN